VPIRIKFPPDSDVVASAFIQAEDAHLLCADCLHKMETVADLRQEDICQVCQNVINGFLKQELQRRGISANAIELE
jgi:hypothetical protein